MKYYKIKMQNTFFCWRIKLMINKYNKLSLILSSQFSIQNTNGVRASLFGRVKNIREISYGSILDTFVEVLSCSNNNSYPILQVGFKCHKLIELSKNLPKSGACWFVHDIHSLVIGGNDDVEVIEFDFLLSCQNRISFRHSQQPLVVSYPNYLRPFTVGTGRFLNHTLITAHVTTLQKVWKFLFIQAEMAVALRTLFKPVSVGNVVRLMDSVIEQLLDVDICHLILFIGKFFFGDFYRVCRKKVF